ncbi:unnamed protein product [Allacma fusca]|uniref:Uncharacterized protein n=1 Tax=Allacma fusca TaxID=39272 RepID=A0A8J2P1X5_9HEXA|nr:unnamed protein product [Allacma fusca]
MGFGSLLILLLLGLMGPSRAVQFGYSWESESSGEFDEDDLTNFIDKLLPPRSRINLQRVRSSFNIPPQPISRPESISQPKPLSRPKPILPPGPISSPRNYANPEDSSSETTNDIPLFFP